MKIDESRILELQNKWQGEGTVDEFLSDWKLTDACDITKWAISLGDMPFREARVIFKDYIKEQPEVARQCFYHIGFLVSPLLRLQWVYAAARNPVVAARMYLEDETTTEQHDNILYASFSNPTTGAPAWYDAIESGQLVRRKTEQKLYNIESPIVQNLLRVEE